MDNIGGRRPKHMSTDPMRPQGLTCRTVWRIAAGLLTPRWRPVGPLPTGKNEVSVFQIFSFVRFKGAAVIIY